LYRIAVNLCRNRLKYLKRRLFFRAEDIQETPEQQMDVRHSWSLANPEQQLMGKQLELFLQRELLQLEEEFRMVFILRDLEQLSYEHIAEITGLALGTVKSRLHRARVLLKQRLERFLKAQEPERASSSSIPELPASIARSIVS
ncbi:MAG: sigma-70 family RNA polymerase sigma factor, partial [Myxococcota bacterium]